MWNPDDMISLGAKRAQCRQCGAPTQERTAQIDGIDGELMEVTMRSAYCSEECEKTYSVRLAAQERRAATLGVFMSAGIPERMQEEYEAVKALVDAPRALRDFIDADNRRRAVHIHGNAATGKTTLALYALDRLAESKQISDALYVREDDLLRALKPFGDRLAEFVNTDLLIIDRCGVTSSASAKDVELFDALIDKREARGGRTITVASETLGALLRDETRALYTKNVVMRLVKLAASKEQCETADHNFILAGLL